MSAIHNDYLPEDYVQQIINIFTTTSVPDFNQLFEKLKTDLISMELQASLNLPMFSAGVHLKNNVDSVDYVLELARTVFNDFVQRGLLDKCINVTRNLIHRNVLSLLAKKEMNGSKKQGNPVFSPPLIRYPKDIRASIVVKKDLLRKKMS